MADPNETMAQCNFGLRIGDSRAIITTTPTPHPLIKDFYERSIEEPDGKVRLVVMTSHENAANIDKEFLNDIDEQYKGTVLYRQEVLGEIIWASPDAMFTNETLDNYRVRDVNDVPELISTVVAIDPAVTNTKNSDSTAIVVCGIDADGHGYVLHSHSMKSSPNAWAQKAISIFDSYDADYIVVEVNNGGDLLKSTLQQARRNLPIKEVRASKAKTTRMEPISLLAEQGKVHIVGQQQGLEDQLVRYNGKGPSPDLFDAMCWGLSSLMLKKHAPAKTFEFHI